MRSGVVHAELPISSNLRSGILRSPSRVLNGFRSPVAVSSLELVNDLIWFYGRRVIFMLCAKHSRAEANSQRSPISKRTAYASLNRLKL